MGYVHVQNVGQGCLAQNIWSCDWLQIRFDALDFFPRNNIGLFRSFYNPYFFGEISLLSGQTRPAADTIKRRKKGTFEMALKRLRLDFKN